MILLNQIAEVLSTDQIAFSQLMTFLTEFNVKISKVLEFNFVSDGKKNGDIISQKQFSMAYLEELEITVSLLSRIMDGYGLLKKNDQEKINYWIALMGMHSLRIFSNITDSVYAFPAVTEHEQKRSLRTLQETISEKQPIETPKPKRSIFDPIPRANPIESKPKKGAQISIFSYRVQSIQVYMLECMLNVFISSYQINRIIPSLDLNALIGASKCILSCYSLIANNAQFYTNLDKISLEEFRDPDITSVSGGITQRYEIGFSNFLKTCKRNFEMIFYLILKFDLNKNLEIKQICNSVARD